ncbi:hypothetical protein ACQKP5_02750 [Pseudomonas vancouverensis]|uniref:hypothetical protein n=1 Tax=Pseudomonas vancouverensis TaxID=95300 RepID=UPI003CFFD166
MSPERVYLNPADGQCDKLLSAKTQQLVHLGEHQHLRFSVADQYDFMVTGHESEVIGALLHCPFCRRAPVSLAAFKAAKFLKTFVEYPPSQKPANSSNDISGQRLTRKCNFSIHKINTKSMFRCQCLEPDKRLYGQG